MPHQDEEPRSSRRGVLKLAVAGIAGAAGLSLGKASEAGATDGSALLVGQDNASAGTTSVTSTTSTAGMGAFEVTGTNADYAVKASGAGIGVYGNGPIGVYGDGSVGGVFSGTDASISLQPRGADGPPTGSNLKGDIALDASGVVWLCIADGSPGTWIKLSHGGVRLLDAPVRLYDSRLTGGAFAPYSTRTIDVTAAGIGVPDAALAIVANLTVTETNDFGFLTAYPAGVSRPDTSNLNWAPLQTIANFATVRLGTSGQISLYVERSLAQVIVDVAGYVL